MTDIDVALLDYAEFGRRFFDFAVTEERVLSAVGSLEGRPIDFGPTNVAPAGLVKVRAKGAVGQPTVERRGGEPITFALDIPIRLELVIEVTLDKHRFQADVLAHLTVTARAAEPLQVVIDVEPPSPRRIDVDLRADGLRASVIQMVGNVEQELKRTVAKVIAKEVDKGRDKRIIDVAKTLSRMGESSRSRPSPS